MTEVEGMAKPLESGEHFDDAWKIVNKACHHDCRDLLGETQVGAYMIDPISLIASEPRLTAAWSLTRVVSRRR